VHGLTTCMKTLLLRHSITHSHTTARLELGCASTTPNLEVQVQRLIRWLERCNTIYLPIYLSTAGALGRRRAVHELGRSPSSGASPPGNRCHLLGGHLYQLPYLLPSTLKLSSTLKRILSLATMSSNILGTLGSTIVGRSSPAIVQMIELGCTRVGRDQSSLVQVCVGVKAALDTPNDSIC
jgi:hypothetical protein